MALYVPTTGVAPADLFEDLSRDLVEQYRAAEARILTQIQRAIDKQLEDPTAVVPDRLVVQLEQVQAAIRNTELANARLGIDPTLADDAISTAVAEGSAAAADRIGLIRVLPPSAGPLTTTATSAVVQVALDVRSSLDDVKLRILRFEDDAYRRIIAKSLPPVLLGTTYSIDQQKQTVARWLSEGIPGFVDKSGRKWSTGAYVEMATRTGLSRAYTEATLYRQQQVGLELVTIVVGASACRSCAQWIGKVLSLSGQTGNVVLPHSTTGAPTTVYVSTTLAAARTGSHLNGPNCRCIVVSYAPGLAIPAGATAYDPEKEAARDRQRELERRLRRDKTSLALSPSEDDQARLRGRIRSTQSELRDHIKQHDLPRKAYREQPAWAGGTPPKATGTPPRPEPSPPTPPRAPEPAPTPPPAPTPAPAAPAAARLADSFTDATTAVEAQAAFRARHGITIRGFEKADDDVARSILGPLSSLIDDYPGVQVSAISAKKLGRGVLAQVSPVAGDRPGSYKPSPLAFSTEFLHDLPAFDQLIARQITVHKHFHPSTSANPWEPTVIHEFAHLLDVSSEEALRVEYAAAVHDALDAAGATTRREILDWKATHLSGYGAKNDAEGVAEAWADWKLNGTHAASFSQVVGPRIDAVIAKEIAG